MALKYDCVTCKKRVTGTKNGRYRSHSDGSGDPCEMSSVEIPEHLLAQPVGKNDDPSVPREGVDFAVCPQCDRKVKLSRLGYFEPHDTTLRGGERCQTSGVRAQHARRTEDVPLPGDGPQPSGAVIPKVRAQEEVEREAQQIPTPSPESTSTSPASPAPQPSTSSDAPAESAAVDSGPWHLAPVLDPGVLQPFSHFFQPFPAPVSVKTAEAMTERGREIATRLREIFYSYNNRNARDNRSAQTTLGPSEIGTPCDRQIAMKLMNIPAVNPQESWAPFVGTAVHASLAEMFEWANGANSGRFAVEMPLTFGSGVVPRGTGDLLDRVLFMFLDHKLMGKYSLKKLVQEGPSETYRVQLHTYGYGAELAGEKVKEIALVGWPREESSLSNLYVHVEPYDRQVALDAIARVERLQREVLGRQAMAGALGPDTLADKMRVAEHFPVGDDCKWCPFFNKADKRMERGCPGK